MMKVWSQSASKRAVVLGVSVALCASTALATESASAGEPQAPAYLDARYSAQERAADLVSRMTLREKVSQLVSSRARAIPRLGVHAYGWWNEAIHGVSREQTNDGDAPPDLINTTSYPVSLSMGATWNPRLVRKVAGEIAGEAREVTQENNRDLNFYSPTVNLTRDPRWGRSDETYSEDPTLTARLASQYVNGMEGKDARGRLLPQAKGYLRTSTTLKHFAANNSEHNRTTGSSDMDERTLREYYTRQFRDIVRSSHPGSVMTSYNSVNGEPTSASTYLMDTLARKTFGFTGFFTSDCDSVREIQHGHHWKPEGRQRPLGHVARGAWASAAGEDLNCNQGLHDRYDYANTLGKAVAKKIQTEHGAYSENIVDTALVRLFTVRIRLGEFDDPEGNPWVRRARARVPKGSWTNSDANKAVTQTPERLALARKAADQSIVLLKNDRVGGGSETKRKGAGSGNLLPLKVPRHGRFRVAVVGEHAKSRYLGGYSSRQGKHGRANETTAYEGVKEAIERINPRAEVDYLSGTTGTDHRVDKRQVARTARYDAVVVSAGTDEDTAHEEKDRTSLQLPHYQGELIDRVAKANPRTVVSLETVGQVDLSRFASHVPAILWSSFNGQRKGDALADVLLGRRDPGGRLPFTWYGSASQLPPIGDYRIRPTADGDGRTYMYAGRGQGTDGAVSYPFGHGLSYASFRTSSLRLDRHRVAADGTVHASARVTNTGDRSGTHVAQLYATTPSAPASKQRPHKRLAGFSKVTLRPHQTKRITFRVKAADLAFFDPKQHRFVPDEGTYGLQLGDSAADSEVHGQASLRIERSTRPTVRTVSLTPHAVGDDPKANDSRVSFPTGTEIRPRPTVAMSDDSLLGYVAGKDGQGAVRPLPEGMRVSYHSNRSGVVRADREGRLRTRGAGVATVTVTVHDHGRAVSTPFVVHVR